MTKKQQNKLVPKLRFPEFKDSGEWAVDSLSNLAEEITDKAGNNTYKLMSITSGQGLVSQIEKFGREIAGNSYRNYIVIKRGDFAFNKSSTKLYPEGEIAMLETENVGAVPNSIFTCFRFNSKIVPTYIKYPFLNNIHGNWLKRFISVGARANGALQVNTSDLFALPIYFPLIDEQQKIADCLSSLDELIASENEKLEAIKQYKKGLMQQLFPVAAETVPKLRFKEFRNSGEWVKKSLGSECHAFSGGTPLTNRQDYYGGVIPFIRSGEINEEVTELFITSEGLKNSSSKMVNKGDILVALYGANSGDVALAKINGAINQAILCLQSKDSNSFIYQYLNLKKDWIVSTYLQGGQGNLSGDIIKSIRLLFPVVKEQEQIAAILSYLDELIYAQAEKIETLKLHKRGLMQQLFPEINNNYGQS